MNEHTNSARCMYVSNLPVGSNDIYFVSKVGTGRFSNTEKLLSMFEGLNKIEEVFLDVIEFFTKKALSRIHDIS